MSSPSSTGSSAKRKRNTQIPSERLKSSTTDLLQPSSRDASAEEAAEEAAEAPSRTSKHKKSANSIDSKDAPPSKRPRTRAAAAATPNRLNSVELSSSCLKVEVPAFNSEDPGEPSSTTEDSEDIERHANQRRGRTTSKSNGDVHGNGNVGKDGGMKPMPKAGLRDPIGGYKTNPPPTGRPVRVYADGVFDLFHLGHMRQLEQAKTAFPETYLLVGVTGDTETHKRKGLTVLTGAERAETVRHCKWVDEVLPNCPWIVTPEFLEKHNVDYVAHDDEPYGADEGDDIYKSIKEQGKFLVTQRTEGVSTTGIITKIVRDYEKYIARQFKRGASRQELNVSWLKKNELDLRRHVTELRDSIRSNWTSTGSEVGKELRQFWQNSRPASPAPGFSGNGGGRVSMEGQKSPTNANPNAGMGSAFEHLKHLEIPGQGGERGRPESMGGSMRGRSEDFAAGYSLGLIGGVRSWMMRGNKSLRGSQPPSPSGSEDDNESLKSPLGGAAADTAAEEEDKTPSRVRKGKVDGAADVMDVGA